DMERIGIMLARLRLPSHERTCSFEALYFRRSQFDRLGEYELPGAVLHMLGRTLVLDFRFYRMGQQERELSLAVQFEDARRGCCLLALPVNSVEEVPVDVVVSMLRAWRLPSERHSHPCSC